jgi:hypothetical protein
LPPFLKRTRFAVEDFNQYLAICSRRSCPAEAVEEAKTKIKQAQKIVEETK